MAKTPRPWIVAPHDPIQKHEENLWSVDGQVPGIKFRRRMTIARREDGSLVFFNAVPLDEPAMEEIRAWGKPAVLIVPNPFHRLDVYPFRERLALKVVCAPAIAARVGQVAAVSGGLEGVGDAAIEVRELAGCKGGETVMIARSDGGALASVVFSDAVMNVPKSTGIITTLMRTTGRPKCPPLFRFLGMSDKRALRADLERIAALPGLRRLIPSHGDVIEGDAGAVIREICAKDL